MLNKIPEHLFALAFVFLLSFYYGFWI